MAATGILAKRGLDPSQHDGKENLVSWSLSEKQLGTNNPRDEGDSISTMFDFPATVGSFKSLVNSPYKKVDIADSAVFLNWM